MSAPPRIGVALGSGAASANLFRIVWQGPVDLHAVTIAHQMIR